MSRKYDGVYNVSTEAVVHRNGFHANIAKFTRKYLCWSIFFACNFLKKRLWPWCFSVNFAKFSRKAITSPNDCFWGLRVLVKYSLYINFQLSFNSSELWFNWLMVFMLPIKSRKEILTTGCNCVWHVAIANTLFLLLCTTSQRTDESCFDEFSIFVKVDECGLIWTHWKTMTNIPIWNFVCVNITYHML